MASLARSRNGSAALAVILTLAVRAASAVTLGQSDTFAGASLEGWHSGPGNPAPPAASTSGGPDGAGDGYLILASNGATGSPGGRLVAIAGPQWTGDYTLAGVSGIAMDLNNLGASELSLRLWLSGAYSAQAVTVPAGSGWQHVVFPTTPSTLTGAGPVVEVSADLPLRLYHAIAAVGPTSADGIVAVLGVDNVTAVPEPSAVWLMLAGLGLGALRARWRRPFRARRPMAMNWPGPRPPSRRP